MLVVRLYLVDCILLELHVHGCLPVSIRRGRSRNLSHCNPITFTLDARGRTWFLTGIAARGLSIRRCCHSATGRLHHDQLRLATALFSFGFLGLAWAAVWYWYYRDRPADHRSVNAAELELILQSDVAPGTSSHVVPSRKILGNRTVWMLASMYFCYGYSIDIYLDWFPKYLYDARRVDLTQMGFFASLPFLAGSAGNLLGGWISDRWAARTGDLKIARRGIAIAGFVIAAGSIIPATFTTHTITSVLFSCLAVFRILE